jgi:hypothetical protein
MQHLDLGLGYCAAPTLHWGSLLHLGGTEPHVAGWLSVRSTPRLIDATALLITVAALTIEPKCKIHCLFSLSLRFWRVQYVGGMI